MRAEKSYKFLGLIQTSELNLPNAITLARMAVIPVFVISLVTGYKVLALWLFILSGASDSIDGVIARYRKQRTEMGAFLDPLADKLFLAATCIAMAALATIPIWLAALVIGREVVIAVGALLLWFLKGNLVIRPTALGKATTVVQLITFGLALLLEISVVEAGTGLAWLFSGAALITVISGAQYVLMGIKQADGR